MQAETDSARRGRLNIKTKRRINIKHLVQKPLGGWGTKKQAGDMITFYKEMYIYVYVTNGS